MSNKLKEALWSLRENKKAQLWIMTGVLIVLAILLLIILVVVNKKEKNDTTDIDTVNIDITENIDTSETTQRFIDGVTTTRSESNLLPVAIMIENLVTVRPQSGLQNANVVYEALAEGGITRFMAIYANNETIEEIGPVRSARHYFVGWAEEYRALYAHAGGSPQALNRLFGNEFLAEDLNQIGGDQAYFWRKTDIAAPHNLFTSSELIQYALRDKELKNQSGSYAPWRFTTESDPEERPTNEQTIVLPFSSSTYEVRYTYDPLKNNYKRENGGEPHTDALTGEQITVKNILVQYVPTSILESDTGRLEIATLGEGDAVLFRDGEKIDGTWKKDKEGERTTYTDSEGNEMTFIPGNTWIELLPEDRTLEYN